MKLQLIPTNGLVTVTDAQGTFTIQARRVGSRREGGSPHYAITVFVDGEPLTDFTDETFLNEPAAQTALKHRPIEVARNLEAIAYRLVRAGGAFLVK